jgi:hypothetical protein
VREEAGCKRWALNDYSDEGARDETWFVPGVRKVHRTIATMMNGLVDAGLTIGRVIEPIPGAEWLDRHPSMRDERRRPMFLLVRAQGLNAPCPRADRGPTHIVVLWPQCGGRPR